MLFLFADDLSSVNNHQSGGSPYTQTTPIAKRAVSYGGEVGFNLRAVCKDNRNVPVIYPFVRYEYIDSFREMNIWLNCRIARFNSPITVLIPFFSIARTSYPSWIVGIRSIPCSL